MTVLKPILIAATLTGLAAALPANAATASRADLESAAGACVANAPSTAMRYTVAGMRNAGTASVYISCAIKNNWNGVASGGSGTGVTYIDASFVNNGTADVVVRCTLNPGASYDGLLTGGGSYPKSATVHAGTQGILSWDAAVSIGLGGRFANPNFSCSLPAGVTLTYFYAGYDEDVGT